MMTHERRSISSQFDEMEHVDEVWWTVSFLEELHKFWTKPYILIVETKAIFTNWFLSSTTTWGWLHNAHGQYREYCGLHRHYLQVGMRTNSRWPPCWPWRSWFAQDGRWVWRCSRNWWQLCQLCPQILWSTSTCPNQRPGSWCISMIICNIDYHGYSIIIQLVCSIFGAPTIQPGSLPTCCRSHPDGGVEPVDTCASGSQSTPDARHHSEPLGVYDTWPLGVVESRPWELEKMIGTWH